MRAADNFCQRQSGNPFNPIMPGNIPKMRVVWSNDKIANKFEMKQKFAKTSMEICELGSDHNFFFKYLLKKKKLLTKIMEV